MEAVVEAARVRLRPILMTSFAFILGVLPLALAQGAGAEMRVPLGVAVCRRDARRDLLRPGLHAGVLQRGDVVLRRQVRGGQDPARRADQAIGRTPGVVTASSSSTCT